MRVAQAAGSRSGPTTSRHITPHNPQDTTRMSWKHGPGPQATGTLTNHDHHPTQETGERSEINGKAGVKDVNLNTLNAREQNLKLGEGWHKLFPRSHTRILRIVNFSFPFMSLKLGEVFRRPQDSPQDQVFITHPPSRRILNASRSAADPARHAPQGPPT